MCSPQRRHALRAVSASRGDRRRPQSPLAVTDETVIRIETLAAL